MAGHPSILAWRIPWTEVPGRLQSTRSQSQTWLSHWAHTHNKFTQSAFFLTPVHNQMDYTNENFSYSGAWNTLGNEIGLEKHIHYWSLDGSEGTRGERGVQKGRKGFKCIFKIHMCQVLWKSTHVYYYDTSVSSVAQSWLTLSDPMNRSTQASLSITNSRSPPKPMSIESVMPSNHLILCRPLLLLPSIFPSIRVFSNESALRIRWPKYWSFSFNISPSNEHPGPISFRMDWLDLLAVQWTLKSLLQHHSSKASILRCSAFFIVQLSYPHMATGKTIALTRQTFVGKVMSLLFNMLSRWVTTFLQGVSVF